MGNYNNLKIDFIERTLALIDQYDELKEKFPFEQRYDHTLLINCLLGLIVMPEQKAEPFIPKQRVEFLRSLEEWGISKSTFNADFKDTRELFYRLRNAVAHFDIKFVSINDEFLIDALEFSDSRANLYVATFYADEFKLFIKYYATMLLNNLKSYHP